MSISRWVVFLVIAGLIWGCAGSANKLDSIQLGMTRDQVIQVMGKPDHVSARENVVFLNYKLRSQSIFADEYFVRITEGKVDLFGRRGDFGVIY
jgi:hypothetical protein